MKCNIVLTAFKVKMLAIKVLSLFLIAAVVGSDAKTWTIETQWDSTPIVNHNPISITLDTEPSSGSLRLSVEAPLFNSPFPTEPITAPTCPQRPFTALYLYEVVEVFIANDQDEYIEIEISPRGRYYLLLLKGQRVEAVDLLPLFPDGVTVSNPCVDQETGEALDGTGCDDMWTGSFVIPTEYLPVDVTKFNAYAIHGVDTWGTQMPANADLSYESLFPIPPEDAADIGGPDFHQLEYFGPLDLEADTGFQPESAQSALWQEATGSESYEMSYLIENAPLCSVSPEGDYEVELTVTRANADEGVRVAFNVITTGDYSELINADGPITPANESIWISFTSLDGIYQSRIGVTPSANSITSLFQDGIDITVEDFVLVDIDCFVPGADAWTCDFTVGWEMLPADVGYMQISHFHPLPSSQSTFTGVLCPGVSDGDHDWLGCRSDRRLFVSPQVNSVNSGVWEDALEGANP